MSNGTQSTSRTGKGGSGAEILLDRSSSHIASVVPGVFDSIVREQLMEMIEGRISDASILRLIRKCISVGVIDDGRLLQSETGTGQGQIISPLLANVYLHFVLDMWIEHEVKPRLRGKVFLIRYADDAVLCFQYREDAEQVLNVLPKRFAKYGLTLHPEKTRLVAFGREALASADRAGTKPDTFDFLGFTHKCARSRRGYFTVHVKTMKKRLRRSLKRVAEWCRTHRHYDVDWQQATLNAKCAATTSTMDVPRTTAVYGSSIGVSGGPGRSGSAGGRGEGRLPGRSTQSSCIAIRYYDPGSHVPGLEQRVLPEEPTGVIPRGGVCEGRGRPRHHGEPIRARSRKRRIQTRNAYSALCSSLLLGV
jgi:Reverse transcriptase (RNA-dependent DNA polymerase)